MKVINTKFKGLKILKHRSYKDERGFLRITHNQNKLKKSSFLNIVLLQKNIL